MITIHIVNVPDPIVWRQEDYTAICGEVVEQAVPANIIPDVMLCSVGIIASTFGRNMCDRCQLHDDPADGLVYFLMSKEDSKKLQKRQEEYAETA